MSEEEKIKQLLSNAELNIKANETRKADEKLFQALDMAKKIHDEVLLNQVFELLRKIGCFIVDTQSIVLNSLRTEGYVLDIGGGGEGIIGKLNGKQVIAIDINQKELEETNNEALKIVMDATDLKFLPNTFDVCTAFFSLMYIPVNRHLKVFEEVYEVLKKKGRFLIWDVEIPKMDESFGEFVVLLKIKLPNEEIETGYGSRWQVQDVGHFRELAKQTEFQVLNSRSQDNIFYLEMLK